MINKDKITTDLCPASVWHRPPWCRWPLGPRCTCCGCGSWVARPDLDWPPRSSSAAPVLSAPPPSEWPEDFSEQTTQKPSVITHADAPSNINISIFFFHNTTHKCYSTLGSATSYLSETGHWLAGDDLIAAEARDEAQGLVLVLPSFQLAQDQSTEYLHILQDIRDERWLAERINRQFPENIWSGAWGEVILTFCLYV